MAENLEPNEELEVLETPTEEVQETPTIPTPDAPDSTADDDRQLFLSSLREQARKIDELNARLAAQAEAKVTAAEEEEIPEYMRPQYEMMSKLIEKKLAASVAPLNETASFMRRREQRAEVERHLLAHAQLGPAYQAVKEQMDSALDSMQSYDPGVVVATLNALYGQAAMTGRLKNGTPTPPKTTPNASPRPVPVTTPPKKETSSGKLNITESERTMARRARMTDEEWVAYRDSDGTISSLSAIGKEKK